MASKIIKDGDRNLFRHAHSDVTAQKPYMKMMARFREEMARDWADEEKVIRVSDGNEKANVRNYSTMPGFSCMSGGHYPPCFTSGAGYCLRDMIYPVPRGNAVHNTVLILKYPDEFRASYRALNAQGMPRLHVEGDFVNETELDVANTESKTIVMTYTKRYAMCNKYFKTHKRNPNFILIYSAWDGLKMENPHNMPVCNVYATANAYKAADVSRRCSYLTENADGTYEFRKGKCAECLMRHYMNNGKEGGGCFDLHEGMTVGMLAH